MKFKKAGNNPQQTLIAFRNIPCQLKKRIIKSGKKY